MVWADIPTICATSLFGIPFSLSFIAILRFSDNSLGDNFLASIFSISYYTIIQIIYWWSNNKNIDNSNQIKLDTYLSDYEDFNVNQYDFTFIKKFRFENINFQAQTGIKYIDINGEKYQNYILEDNYYMSYFLNLNANYNGFILGLGVINGDRLFSVQEDGLKVEHHALEQNKTYLVSLGKKFQNIDVITKYIYSNSKELPENREDVSSEFFTLGLNYKF